MSLRKITDQSRYSVEEFYREHEKSMLPVVEGLNVETGEEDVYCFTSHNRLCLVSQDDSSSLEWVIISPTSDPSRFDIECRIPDRFAPWRNAYAKKRVDSPEEAVATAILAMKYSEGWTEPNRNRKIDKEKLSDYDKEMFRKAKRADALLRECPDLTPQDS